MKLINNFFWLVLSGLVLTNNAWSQDDLDQLINLMTLSPDAISDKSLGFYSAGSDLLVSQEDLATEQLLVLLILNGPELQPVNGHIEWSADGVQWHNAEFNKADVQSGKTGHIKVSLPQLPHSSEIQRIVFRTRLTGHVTTHESRQLVTILPSGEARQAVFYDIGGTVQAKYKLKAKKAKNLRDPFDPVFRAIREDMSAGLLVVFLTSKEQEDGHMIRAWFREHGLPPGPILMPRARCCQDNGEDFKFKVLNYLKGKVKVIRAWGNGVEKDILPYMKAGVCTIHHISWPLSEASSIKLLVASILQNYLLQSRIKLAHCAGDICIPAVLSTYIIDNPACKRFIAQPQLCSSDSPPGDDPDSPPCFYYPESPDPVNAVMLQQFDHWVSGQGQTVSQLWPGLLATLLYFAALPAEAAPSRLP
ncbi:MAG: LNS2 domain-containing protein [Endozoicomonas sp.]|uniref:LNS2 domain-containing protein n=1 Tax=Endozoicomonas sp. TaxID=1892382 RepID=UPI003D9B706D